MKRKIIFIQKKETVAFFFLIFVFIFSLTSPIGYSPDYLQYDYYFDMARDMSMPDLFGYRFEPGFAVLVKFLTLCVFSNELVFALISCAAIYVKLRSVIFEVSAFGLLLVVILFLFKIFPLQELNQIRAALAVSFLFLFYTELIGRARIYLLLFYFLLSVSFHYSASLLAPFLVLVALNLNRSKLFPFALLIFFLLKLLAEAFVAYLGTAVLVVSSYNDAGLENVAASSLISPVFFPEFLLIFLSFLFWRECSPGMRRIVALQVFGFSFFYALGDFNVFAVRGRELFSVFWLVFVVDYERAGLRMKWSILLFVFSSVALGLYLFYIGEYFSFYKTMD